MIWGCTVQGAMVRVPLFPVEWYLQALSAPDGLADYLLEILHEPAFMEALWLASPSLAREAERWRDGEKAPGTSQLLGLLRYLIRATTRPTPFGLFAGVAFVPIEEQTRLRLAGLGSHQKRARLDYGQALAFVQSLERDPALRSELYVYANPALLRWYSRIRVTCRDGYGRGQDPGQAWIRLTDPVQVILEYAARPVQYGDLIRRLQERYPQSSEVDIDLFLLKLLDESVLLSTLRPPLTEMEPHSYLARMIPPTSPPSETTERVLQASRLIQAIPAVASYVLVPRGHGGIRATSRSAGQMVRRLQDPAWPSRPGAPRAGAAAYAALPHRPRGGQPDPYECQPPGPIPR